MKLGTHHLTYCTNVHPAESWTEVFKNLKEFAPAIKSKISPGKPFGLGVYLSNVASMEILTGTHLQEFKSWLNENELYVFTMNGFPFGGFHEKALKDKVYRPDWNSRERVDFTKRLFHILAELLPQNVEGGISTSPVSYKYWFDNEVIKQQTFSAGALHLAEIAEVLHRIYLSNGKFLHLDIEPEPDCFLENSDEVIRFFNEILIPEGTLVLVKSLGIEKSEAEKILRRHIRLCYDVCHFAVEYEYPEDVFRKLKANGIAVGKIQISAALKANLEGSSRSLVLKELKNFVEPTYLHQTIEKDISGKLHQYRDLNFAIENNNPDAAEWRTHFHVPVFVDNFGLLQSTQEDISRVLEFVKKEKITNHLEVETYTWDVLPAGLKTNLTDSICRELEWVIKKLGD